MPGLCRGRLQGERDLCAGKGSEQREAPAPLARGQSTPDLEMLLLQEDLLVVRVLDRLPMRVVRHDVSRWVPQSTAGRVQVWHPGANLFATTRRVYTAHRGSHGGDNRRASEAAEYSVAARPFLS